MEQSLKDKIYTLKAKRDISLANLNTATESLITNVQRYKDLVEARTFVQNVALEVQQEIQYSIESIVNIFLDTMFPTKYTFKVVYEVAYNKTTARLVLMSGNKELDVLDSNGGGVADVVATALRIALLLITNKDKVILYDEVAKFVSEDKKELYYEVLERISKDLGIQLIMVTHDEKCKAIATNNIRVMNEEGISRV